MDIVASLNGPTYPIPGMGENPAISSRYEMRQNVGCESRFDHLFGAALLGCLVLGRVDAGRLVGGDVRVLRHDAHHDGASRHLHALAERPASASSFSESASSLR